MPNYCHNRLRIQGPDAELRKLRRAVADAESKDKDDRFSYAKIVPVAAGEDHGKAWGSTSVYCLKIHRSSGELVYEFESSWDPPLAVVAALARQWPALTLEHVFVEPCTGWYGSRYFAAGGIRYCDMAPGLGCDDDDVRAFVECEWPELAAKWWDDDAYEDAA
jgi:hypothetical protein